MSSAPVMDRTIVVRSNEYQVEEFPWGSLTWFVSAALGSSNTLTAGRCVIKPGHENPRHHHPNCEEVLHVLHGSIIHSMEDGRNTEMHVGDTISVPLNVVHNARNICEDDAVLFICFSSADRRTVGE